MTALHYHICSACPECTLHRPVLWHSRAIRWVLARPAEDAGPETSLFPSVAGYTVTSVVSSRQGRVYVAGAPRFNHTGKAILFTMHNNRSLTIHQSLRGEQVTKGEAGLGRQRGQDKWKRLSQRVAGAQLFTLSRTVLTRTDIFPGWGALPSSHQPWSRRAPSPESQALIPAAARRSRRICSPLFHGPVVSGASTQPLLLTASFSLLMSRVQG